MPIQLAVKDALAWHGVTDEIRIQRLVFEWNDLVGARIGARTSPDGLSRTAVAGRDGVRVLWVRVINSAWLHELTLLKDQLTHSIRAGVGDPPLFEELRFHLGRPPVSAADLLDGVTIRRPPPAPRRRPTAAGPGRAAAIDAETLVVEDPELRALIRDVRTRNDR